MQCEVCGREINGTPYVAIIEGAKMTVCHECAKLGSTSWKIKPQIKKTVKPSRTFLPLKVSKEKRSSSSVELTYEFVDNLGVKVRKAREKLGLSQEDLGRKIREKVSLLKKIETGKVLPNYELATKLEHTLKIKLVAPASEPETPLTPLFPSRGITLGDIVHLKKEKAEANKKRER
ncbi:MAG: multiprotein bridging factor aMBF1 [Thermoproteota archaeon]|nr:multiprotein bridging factor aMBF1 [Thermoproteota archaeon]